MSITRRRLLGLAVAVAAAASVISAGASALASSGGTHVNYQGPARPGRAVVSTRGTNYRGPARTSPRASAVPGSNLPASGTAQR